MTSDSVEFNFGWEWIDCDDCGATWRSDELKFVPSDVGPDLFYCRCCDSLIAEERIDDG